MADINSLAKFLSGIFFIIGSFLLVFLWMIIPMFSCGGRDNCEKKFCIIGITNDYHTILSIISIFCLVFGLLGAFVL
jgi:hypothetical protein